MTEQAIDRTRFDGRRDPRNKGLGESCKYVRDWKGRKQWGRSGFIAREGEAMQGRRGSADFGAHLIVIDIDPKSESHQHGRESSLRL